MIIPNLLQSPIGRVGEDGHVHLNSEWHDMLHVLFNQLQQNVSNEGLVAPPQPTTNINQLADPTRPNSFGALWYDTTTNQLKVNIAGVVKVVTVT